jgi:hypothetical protein
MNVASEKTKTVLVVGKPEANRLPYKTLGYSRLSSLLARTGAGAIKAQKNMLRMPYVSKSICRKWKDSIVFVLSLGFSTSPSRRSPFHSAGSVETVLASSPSKVGS